MGNCHPEKANVDQGEAEVDIVFRDVTISHVTLSFSINHFKLIITDLVIDLVSY